MLAAPKKRSENVECLLKEPETEPCSRETADSSPEFSSAPGDSPKLTSGSSGAVRLCAIRDTIQELLSMSMSCEAHESLPAIAKQLDLLECSVASAALAVKTELQGGKLAAIKVVDQQDVSVVAGIPGEMDVSQQHNVGVSDVADHQHSSAAAAIPSEPEVAQRQTQIQQHDNSSILQQGVEASKARVEAIRILEDASATLSPDLAEVLRFAKNTDTTRGAAAAYRQLLRACNIHLDAQSEAALKSAEVCIRNLVVLRCQCEVGSEDMEAYWDAVTAAFGTLLDEEPNLRSQLKLCYHKVVNSHPSKNQIETDKRGSQRPMRRRNPSRTQPQDRGSMQWLQSCSLAEYLQRLQSC